MHPGAFSAVPAGLGCFSNSTQDSRPGLLSAVPTGLDLSRQFSHRLSSPHSCGFLRPDIRSGPDTKQEFSAACRASFRRRNQEGFAGAFWLRFGGSRWRRRYRQKLRMWRSKDWNARDSGARPGRGFRLQLPRGWPGPDLNEICVAAWDNFQKSIGKESKEKLIFRNRVYVGEG